VTIFMKLFSNSDFQARVAENGQPARFESFPLNDFLGKLNGKFLLVGTHEHNIELIKKFRDKSGIIIFDAHASALPGVHDSFLRRITEILPSSRIILVGVREFSIAEHTFLKESKIRYFSMQSVHENIVGVCDTVMENANPWIACHVFISLDVLDPAFVSVPRPSVGGMTSRELIYFVQRLRFLRNYTSAGIVDFENSIQLAEKLLCELAVQQ